MNLSNYTGGEKNRLNNFMFTPSTTLKPFIRNVSPEDYHSAGEGIKRGDPRFVMSRSQLQLFDVCPNRWLAGYKEEATDDMKTGALFDVVTLTPDAFPALYAVHPETYPAEGKKKGDPVEEKPWNWNATFCKNWRGAQEKVGSTAVHPRAASDAWAARAALLRNEHIAALLAVSSTQCQVNVEWNDEDTCITIPFKCLIDIVPEPGSQFGDTIADYKTCNDASFRTWGRTVFTYGLHIQAAIYLDAINAATGLTYRNFEHVIQEKFAPFECTHRMLSAEFLAIGRSAYQLALSEYCRTLTTKRWRGYDSNIVEPEHWMITV